MMGKRKNLNSSFGSASDLDDDDVYFGLEDDGVSLWLNNQSNTYAQFLLLLLLVLILNFK